MSAFTELLADPFAEKSFIVTVRPCADISGSIAVAGGANVYAGAPGTFSGLIHGDRLLASGFAVSGNNGYAVVASVADGGSSIVVTGLALTTESAGSRRLYGEVARYYSTHGLTTSPSETPANTWYDGRVENALRFTRSLVDGDRIGGRSIPGFGSVVLQNLDGDMDPMRRWGWSGRSIVVEMGGPLFARSAYGVVFNGLTSGVQFDDRVVTISVTDLQGLLEQAPWRPVYLGTGGLEGGAQGNLGLAIADVAADQAVHRPRPLHVLLYGLDRRCLVGRLLPRKARLKVELPLGIFREGPPFAAAAFGVKVEQLAGKPFSGFTGPCFERLPALAAKF